MLFFSFSPCIFTSLSTFPIVIARIPVSIPIHMHDCHSDVDHSHPNTPISHPFSHPCTIRVPDTDHCHTASSIFHPISHPCTSHASNIGHYYATTHRHHPISHLCNNNVPYVPHCHAMSPIFLRGIPCTLLTSSLFVFIYLVKFLCLV